MNHFIEDARTKIGAGDLLSAVALLTQAITQGEEPAEARWWRARVFASMGCLKEAEEDADRLLAGAQDGGAEEVCLLKAGLRLKAGDPEGAVSYYNKVREWNPANGEAYVGLSAAHAAAHRYDRALAVMDEALDRLPDFAEGYKERGRIRFLLHDEAGAMDDLKRALALSPETAREVEGRFTNL